MKKILSFLIICFLSPVSVAYAQGITEGGVFQDEYLMGEVVEADEGERSEIIGDDQVNQTTRIRVLDGEYAGTEFETEHQYQAINQELQALEEGDQVVIVRNQEFDEAFYYIADTYRLPAIYALLIAFVVLTIALTGWKGVSSLIGLGFNILVIIYFIIPRIIAGDSPLVVSFLGGIAILFVSLYFAHGFNKRTTIALGSTLITLIIALLASLLFVSLTKLSGAGTEEAFLLQLGNYGSINLRGLLLGGIIIGALGVLDDVTTAQSAAIDELKKANPKMNFKQLYTSGLSIGSEHITSLVNTLALAYAGSSLPVLLLFTTGSQPLWVIINSAYVTEELVRTLVGSVALILAVPITTILAAYFYSRPKLSTSASNM